MSDPETGTGQRRTAHLTKGLKEYALRVIAASLEEVPGQPAIDLLALTQCDRPTLGTMVPVALFRTVRLLALRDVLGSRISSAVMKVSGRSISRKMNVSSTAEMISTLERFCVGRVSIEEQTDDRMVVSCAECVTCSGLPNIGEAVCSFEAGFVSGVLEREYGVPMSVVETQCWGLGDRICRWEARRELDPDLLPDSLNPVEIVIGLAGKAASAVDAAIAIKQKNRELREACHRLRDSEQLKQDLTDMVVHDMRLPLTSIIGSMEMLADSVSDRLSCQEAEMLRLALTSGRALLHMTDDLLDISKLEERKFILRTQPTRIGYLVEDAISQVEIPLKRKRLNLVVGLPERLPEIAVDRDRIVRVLANLLINAVRHTPCGGEISVAAIPGPTGDVVKISVRDNGEGIPREYHRRIFDKFVQVESGKPGKRTSSGLGLTFCKLATEAHGGSISLESTPGVGSTFTISLPAVCIPSV